MPEIERSPADLVATWGKHAALLEVVAPPAGLGLLELRLPTGGVVYALDRSGPFVFRRGSGRILLQATVETLDPADPEAGEGLSVAGVSAVTGTGVIVESAKNLVVVQAGVPILLGVLDDSWRQWSPGRSVSFTSLEPLHAFAVDAVAARM